jgi:glucokinase
MHAPSSTVALVADIGGTNARFALATRDGQGRPALTSMREFTVAQFASLAQAALHYLREIDPPRPRRSVIAVASPVTSDEIKATNSSWTFSIAGLQQELGLEAIEVINDFAAIAMAIPHLTPGELALVGAAPGAPAGSKPDRRHAVVGPGTGLGVCGLLLRQGRAIVIESEGGHIAFAPGGDYEIAILQYLLKRHARVSIERLLSGPGLQNLYDAVCAVEGAAAVARTPESITIGAKLGTEATCQRAVESFCSILGSFAGDVALMYGAWDGVYLGGGMTTTLLPWICSGEFRQRFENKGRYRALMQKIPTCAIAHAQPGLLGAGACALDPSV